MIPKLTKASLEAIIDTVEERFPNRLPKTNTTTDQIHMLIGQQQVIAFLRELMEARYD